MRNKTSASATNPRPPEPVGRDAVVDVDGDEAGRGRLAGGDVVGGQARVDREGRPGDRPDGYALISAAAGGRVREGDRHGAAAAALQLSLHRADALAGHTLQAELNLTSAPSRRRHATLDVNAWKA